MLTTYGHEIHCNLLHLLADCVCDCSSKNLKVNKMNLSLDCLVYKTEVNVALSQDPPMEGERAILLGTAFTPAMQELGLVVYETSTTIEYIPLKRIEITERLFDNYNYSGTLIELVEDINQGSANNSEDFSFELKIDATNIEDIPELKIDATNIEDIPAKSSTDIDEDD